jgi:hypothetical protein
MDSTTRLAWLGDVIPVPPVQKVISVGDIVLLLGTAGLIATTMRAPRTPRARLSSPSVPGPPIDNQLVAEAGENV